VPALGRTADDRASAEAFVRGRGRSPISSPIVGPAGRALHAGPKSTCASAGGIGLRQRDARTEAIVGIAGRTVRGRRSTARVGVIAGRSTALRCRPSASTVRSTSRAAMRRDVCRHQQRNHSEARGTGANHARPRMRKACLGRITGLHHVILSERRICCFVTRSTEILRTLRMDGDGDGLRMGHSDDKLG